MRKESSWYIKMQTRIKGWEGLRLLLCETLRLLGVLSVLNWCRTRSKFPTYIIGKSNLNANDAEETQSFAKEKMHSSFKSRCALKILRIL